MKKKVLFIQETLDGGGAEKVLINILSNFNYDKYDITLLLLIKSGVYLDDIDPRVKLLSLFNDNKIDNHKRIIAKKLFANYNSNLFFKLIIKRLSIGKFDTIISFLEGETIILHEILMKNAKRNITWVHSDFINFNWTRNIFPKNREADIYKRMDDIVFVSNDSMAQFYKNFNITPSGNRIIYNPIPREKIILESKENTSLNIKRKLTISTIGRLIPVKGYDRLIRVAKQLKDSEYDVDFWIIGSGLQYDELKEMTIALNIEDSVRFLGFHKNPYPYIAQSDIFISTSEAEGFSLVICEALCLGKPIVSTVTTGPREILENGKYGILTEHNDNSIKEGLIKLITDSQLRERYSMLSAQRAEMFNISLTLNEIYNLIDDKM